MALKALYQLWKYGKTVSKGALARFTSMAADHNLRLAAITVFTFLNFFSNFWAALTQLEGNKLFLAVESLGVTLGASITQITNGLTILVTPEVGIIKWVMGLVTILLGTSTIYIWFKGNGLFVRFVESTNPTLVHRVYMVAILFLAVIAYHDSTAFYELYNLTTELGMNASAQAANAEAATEAAAQTANNASVQAQSLGQKISTLKGFLS